MSSPASAPVPAQQPKRTNLLLNLIVTILATLFMEAAANDYALARAAALETVNEYRARSGVDLLLVAQIIACSLAAVSTLLKSMQGGVDTDRMLRMQCRADALDRGAHRNRRALEKARNEPSHPEQMDAAQEAEIVANVTQLAAELRPTAQTPAPSPRTAHQPVAALPMTAQPTASRPATPDQAAPRQQDRSAWITAYAQLAQEITDSLPSLPPEQRRAAAIQANALADVARDMRSGTLDRNPR